jgi:hypothetical protein
MCATIAGCQDVRLTHHFGSSKLHACAAAAVPVVRFAAGQHCQLNSIILDLLMA